jgi:hypothetical protein
MLSKPDDPVNVKHWFVITPKRIAAMAERETLAFSIDVGRSGAIASRLAPTFDVY